MSLINCPECDSSVSGQAVSCPKCGFPISVKSYKIKQLTDNEWETDCRAYKLKKIPDFGRVYSNYYIKCKKCNSYLLIDGCSNCNKWEFIFRTINNKDYVVCNNCMIKTPGVICPSCNCYNHIYGLNVYCWK
jgi:hypothetical protein